MIEGFLEQYHAIEIDENEHKFQYISNYNRFQGAKDQGKIKSDLQTFLEFLKYERTHANRDLVVSRLFNLAMSEYKDQVRKEMEAKYAGKGH